MMGSVFKSTSPIIVQAIEGGSFPGRSDCTMFAIEASQEGVADPFSKEAEVRSGAKRISESGTVNMGLCPNGQILMDPRLKGPPFTREKP